MSDCKTVTHKGNVYEIGGVYEFSDGGDYWTIDSLVSIDCAVAYPFKVRDCEWSLIREAEYKIGTIAPAPIEPTMADLFVSDFRECAHLSKCVDIMIDKGWKK
jgi:hypothetical protein